MIDFDFQKAGAQARALLQIADELKSVSRQLEACQQQLSAAWTGEASNLFAARADNLRGDIARNAGSVKAVGNAVSTVSAALKAAEDAAVLLVNGAKL